MLNFGFIKDNKLLMSKIIKERSKQINSEIFNKIVSKFKNLSQDDKDTVNQKMKIINEHLDINNAREKVVEKTTSASMQNMIERIQNFDGRFYLFVSNCKEYIIDIINMICWQV
jgi:hypothetical protein